MILKEMAATIVQHIQDDIALLTSMINDTIATGENMFGQYGHPTIKKDVLERNRQLKAEKESLSREINANQAVIERANRDFSDVELTQPVQQPEKKLNVIEDYTVAFLVLSYGLMVVTAIVVYGVFAPQGERTKAIFKAVLAAAIATPFFGMIFYVFA